MQIPSNFINIIADTFYDKDLIVLDKSTIYDVEGGINVKGMSQKDTFKGNVSFTNFKTIQENFGIDYQIDIAITTYRETNVVNDDIIKYSEIIYKITDVLKTDSHLLILATKWRQ